MDLGEVSALPCEVLCHWCLGREVLAFWPFASSVPLGLVGCPFWASIGRVTRTFALCASMGLTPKVSLGWVHNANLDGLVKVQ